MAYDCPKGIPNPNTSFGWEIDRATIGWPASWLTGTTTPTAGYYYIDKTDPAATNTANTYGHPDLPRLTPPEGALNAGDFVYIHAGTYTNTDSGGDRFNWHGAGTTGSPIWITGNPAARPIIQDRCHIGDQGDASFIIFENFEVSGTIAATILIYGQANGRIVDHILVRNCVVTGTQSESDSSGINIGRSQSTDTYPLEQIHDVVIYNCVISNFGDKATSDEAGVYNGLHTDSVWVLDNTIHDVASDGVAGSHYANYTDKTATNYYIGRNTIYGNGENGIDLKAIQGGVISENHIYGPFARGSGTAIVLHYGASPSFACKDVAVVFNRIHHCGGGIANGGSFGNDDAIIVGNLLYDIHNSYAVAPDPLFGNCIQIGGSAGNILIADNTLYDYDEGISLSDITVGTTVKLHGNIFGSVHTDVARFELETVNGEESRISLNYNLYPAGASFFWANASRTLAYMQATALQEANAVSGDPLFIDSGSGNFGLDTGSPAIGVSVEGPVGDSAYTAFQTMFGESILFDFDGVPRPASGAWDMGALEYVADTYTLNITTLNATTLTVG